MVLVDVSPLLGPNTAQPYSFLEPVGKMGYKPVCDAGPYWAQKTLAKHRKNRGQEATPHIALVDIVCGRGHDPP